MNAYAAKVVQNVYGKGSKELRSLSDPRPLTKRDAVRKAATKAKNKATKLLAKAKKAAKPKALAASGGGMGINHPPRVVREPHPAAE